MVKMSMFRVLLGTCALYHVLSKKPGFKRNLVSTLNIFTRFADPAR